MKDYTYPEILQTSSYWRPYPPCNLAFPSDKTQVLYLMTSAAISMTVKDQLEHMGYTIWIIAPTGFRSSWERKDLLETYIAKRDHQQSR